MSAGYRICSQAGAIDLARTLEKVGSRFGVRTLLLEGGGRINGAMLRSGLVDEVSLLIAPVADGRIGKAALFDAETITPHRLALEAVEQRDASVVWLRYRVESAAASA